MISVLIPTYNYNSYLLVKETHKQLTQSNQKFEIICIDDASKSEHNSINFQINKLNYCTFTTLKNNIGRSKIRNHLASIAKYDNLLFLDGDVFPPDSNFITNYIDKVNSNYKVVCGGVVYKKERPQNSNMLRWTFGSKREKINTIKRKKSPYRYFFTSNFLIKKSVFEKIKFNEAITDYGYEDLVFAFDLRSKKIKINHINNPVYHLGLEQNSDFIRKTQKSIENGLKLYKRKLIKKGDIKLVSTFLNLKSFKLNSLFSFFFTRSKRLLELNLNSKNPSLFLFDIYKLGYMCFVDKKRLF